MAQTPLSSALASEEDKLLACIHCGLCLEACPTYVATGDENDGPRGRLYLMRAVGEGRLANTSTAFERHIDRCLGCRACEQVCPAGVEYGQLLEASRHELFASNTRQGFRYKVVRFVLKHVWLHPLRLKFAFIAARVVRDARIARMFLKTGFAGLLPKQFQFGLALLESSSAGCKKKSGPGWKKNLREPSTEDAMLFTGCVGAGLFSRVNEATARVLAANGFAVDSPRDQVCCGALHAHAGDLEGARILARKNLRAFSRDPKTLIVTNAGGCGAMLAGYGHLLAADEACAAEASKFSARVRDVSQALRKVQVKTGGSLNGDRVTYDASCHLLYGQRVGDEPLEMLSAVKELNFSKLEGSERCCGGAGIYNMVEPDLSAQVLAEKLTNIQATGATVLATGNPGCQMQIGAGALLRGMELRVCHPVELLDESYARAGLYSANGAE